MRAKQPKAPKLKVYEVEQIVGYELQQVDNYAGHQDYDPTLGATRWEVRYLVKWKGYDPSDNSWEPRSSFDYWQLSYEEQLAQVQADHPSKPSAEQYREDAIRRNEQLAAALRRGRGAKKSAAQVKQLPNVKQEGALEGKKVTAELTPAPSYATSSSSIEPSPRLGRSTRNSQDPAAFSDLQSFIKSENAPPEVRQLAYGARERSHAGGRARALSEATTTSLSSASAAGSSVIVESEGSTRSGGPERELQTTRSLKDKDVVMKEVEPPVVAAAEDEIGFADSGSEDEAAGRKEEVPVQTTITLRRAVEASGQGESDPGFDESSDDEIARQLAVGATATETASVDDQAGPDGFADASSDEDMPLAEAGGSAGCEGTGFAEASSEDDFAPTESTQIKNRPKGSSASKKPTLDSRPSAAASASSSRAKQPSPPPISKPKVKPSAPPPDPPRKTSQLKSQQPRKKPRIIESDSSDSDQLALSALRGVASGSSSAIVANPKLALLKFKKVSKASDAAPTPAQPTPPAPKPALAVVTSLPPRPLPAPAPAPTAMARTPPFTTTAPMFFVQPRPPPTSEPSRDPRQRKGSIQHGSADRMGTAGSPASPPPPPQSAPRPFAEPGFLPLSTPALELALRATNFLARQPPPTASSPTPSLASRVRSAWEIGNPLLNFFDFDAVMRQGPLERTRSAFIFASAKDGPPTKEAKAVKSDYIALQLLLSTIEGVRQADSLLNPAVSAVFVHVSDVESIRSGSKGKLPELQRLRERRVGETIFVLFGEREKEVERRWKSEAELGETKSRKESVFHRFWDTAAAITFTPKSFVSDSQRLSSFITTWSKSAGRWPGRRDLFPFAHVAYLLPGGAFELPPKGSEAWKRLMGNEQARQILHDFHSLARDRQRLALTKPLPLDLNPSTPYFPSYSDSQDYATDGKIVGDAQWFPRNCFFDDLEKLSRLVGVYQGSYIHIRHWIIIATGEEISSLKSRAAGISYLTLDEAEAELAKAPFVGPH